MKKTIPKDEPQFLEFIQEIDNDLKNRNISIDKRPFHAIMEAAKRLDIELIFPPANDIAVSGIYYGDSLLAHISNWYEERYKNRLKVFSGLGHVAVLIKGDPWKIIIPLILSANFICHYDLEKYKNVEGINANFIPTYNILGFIDGFQVSLAKELTREELNYISRIFIAGLNALHSIKEIRSKPLISEANADLESAMSYIFLDPPQYGFSKFSSLQFVEKLLKCYLKLRNKKFRRAHNLSELVELTKQNGLTYIPKQSLIDKVQCLGGVRYGEIPVLLKEAIEAHHASIEICENIAPEIKTL